MTPPFAESSRTEVLVRVLVAYVKLRHAQHPSTLRSWSSMRSAIAPVVQQFGGELSLLTVLLAFDVAAREGSRIGPWASEAIRCSRFGATWRRCLYPNYKALRDPRVTNRGVTE